MLRGVLLTMMVLCGAEASGAAQGVAPFAFGGRDIAPGTRVDLELPVSTGATDPATVIPVTVFHGSRPGPRLVITAGVHGYEFPPILAAQQLLTRIDPGSLAGTVILVRLAHVSAFEQRTPFVNPFDRKNLNRVFPGRADGTQSERIAHVLSTQVISRADLHVELHSGDGAEWLEPFVGFYGGTLARRQEPAARRMALSFGFPNLVRYAMETEEQIDTNRSLNRQAVSEGVPTILVELGENGRRDEALVTRLVDGVGNLLRALDMQTGSVAMNATSPRQFSSTAEAVSTTTGIFTPTAVQGRAVSKGDLIGTVTDYAGKEIERIVSPVDGYVLYGITGPPVRAGDAVVTIGVTGTGE
jgi:hypothetical protein